MPEIVVETQFPQRALPSSTATGALSLDGARAAEPRDAAVPAALPAAVAALPVFDMPAPQKALLLLVSLDEDVATRMIASLDDRELALLKETIASMREVPAAAITSAQREFIERIRAGVPTSLSGSEGYLRRLVSSAHGAARAHALFEPGSAQAASPSVFMQIPPKTLAGLLTREHPQTAALVLSQLEGTRGSEVLLALPEELRRDVVLRLGHLESVPDAVLAEVEAEYRVHQRRLEGAARRPVHGKDVAAALLKRVGQDESSALLDAMQENDGAMADSLRQALFTFEDLKAVDVRGMQQLLKEVATDQLLIALKTASEEIRQKVFSSLSSRAADMLREDLSLLGPTRLSDVEAAQRTIVETALQLERDGRITITRAGAGDFV
jgi:flagellar motor switch protein FliG